MKRLCITLLMVSSILRAADPRAQTALESAVPMLRQRHPQTTTTSTKDTTPYENLARNALPLLQSDNPDLTLEKLMRDIEEDCKKFLKQPQQALPLLETIRTSNLSIAAYVTTKPMLYKDLELLRTTGIIGCVLYIQALKKSGHMRPCQEYHAQGVNAWTLNTGE